MGAREHLRVVSPPYCPRGVLSGHSQRRLDPQSTSRHSQGALGAPQTQTLPASSGVEPGRPGDGRALLDGRGAGVGGPAGPMEGATSRGPPAPSATPGSGGGGGVDVGAGEGRAEAGPEDGILAGSGRDGSAGGTALRGVLLPPKCWYSSIVARRGSGRTPLPFSSRPVLASPNCLSAPRPGPIATPEFPVSAPARATLASTPP